MILKDISFSGFFKIFGIVHLLIFLLTALIGITALLVVPDRITINDFKILGILTLDLGDANIAPIVLLIIGFINSILSVTLYALIAVILTKLPFIGRIKITPTAYDEQVFD